MRQPVRCLEISTSERSHSEMERIGVDPHGAAIMAPKQLHYNIKLDGLAPAQANIIKQEMLSLGGEAAVSSGVVSCRVESTGALVSGTLWQLDGLVRKLRDQGHGLGGIGSDIEESLGNYRRGALTLKGRSKEWVLGGRTLIMGIVNVTPDSFSDGGKYLDRSSAVEHALRLVEEGADWVDVGGESTRPGSSPVTADEEIARVVPVVEELARRGVDVSVDTSKAVVARASLEAGAAMINDVTALADAGMAGVVAGYGCPVVLMHMRGTPETMQADVRYADLTAEVYSYLHSRLEYAAGAGISRQSIVIDPGIGFGKSPEGNLELIRNLAEFKSLGVPVLLGHSRKSFISRTLGDLPGTVEAGTSAVSALAAYNGAHILRVHDVAAALPVVRMADAVRGTLSPEKREES